MVSEFGDRPPIDVGWDGLFRVMVVAVRHVDLPPEYAQARSLPRDVLVVTGAQPIVRGARVAHNARVERYGPPEVAGRQYAENEAVLEHLMSMGLG